MSCMKLACAMLLGLCLHGCGGGLGQFSRGAGG